MTIPPALALEIADLLRYGPTAGDADRRWELITLLRREGLKAESATVRP